MHNAIFLTTPSGLFTDLSTAHRCARALLAKIKYYCDKHNVTNTTVDVGVSNVDPRKAQYISVANGVGRPNKKLVGNLKNCYVNPHLHVVIQGKFSSKISNLIIQYFIKKYDDVKNKKSVRIWKKYIIRDTESNVIDYIWAQSIHYLRFKSKKSNNVEKTKKRIIKVGVKNQKNIRITVSQDNYAPNYVLLCNMRCQWNLIAQLKNIAKYIGNFELYDRLVILQNKIKKYGDMINANINVASLYYTDVTNITIELENLRQITVVEKQKYDYFVVQA